MSAPSQQPPSTQPSQADILAALASGAFRPKQSPTTRPYFDFSDPTSQLSEPGSSGSTRVNATRVYCFRPGCGSLILLPGAGEWVASSTPVLPQDPTSPFPHTPTLSAYIHVPTPFSFENIGYSRPDPSATSSFPADAPGREEAQGKAVKWLICAECDLGPVGWGYEGGRGSWVAVERVRFAPPPSDVEGK